MGLAIIPIRTFGDGDRSAKKETLAFVMWLGRGVVIHGLLKEWRGVFEFTEEMAFCHLTKKYLPIASK